MGTILIIILILVLIGALAAQQELGILSKRRTRGDRLNPDHPVTPWKDLKRFQGMRTHCELV
jgi:hypothetical protein